MSGFLDITHYPRAQAIAGLLVFSWQRVRDDMRRAVVDGRFSSDRSH